MLLAIKKKKSNKSQISSRNNILRRKLTSIIDYKMTMKDGYISNSWALSLEKGQK